MAKEGPPPPPRRTSAAVVAFVAASLMTSAAEASRTQTVSNECSKAQAKVEQLEKEYAKKKKECPQGRATNEICRSHLWILASAINDAKSTERHRCNTVAENRTTRS